ncbi:helix-turn-helix transcriptional regulator [Brevibacillus ruminantium]|uniref:Helix-turn-helix transcriptional regulator n=1 Tax=Brevibacillus ruminantium TaxID=2950604 RepID=A0ABY4WD55_9BACL|nr:helix-turn-helix transcriptional regulator [Brevibacillus ruminantium]USG65112.1 helix-turn-helix transcriptional regulator [Brevibacillus ruminantium]
MVSIGKLIKEARKKQNMTQELLAIGICNRSYISQIEKGLVVPSRDVLEKLYNRLNIIEINYEEKINEIVECIDEGDFQKAITYITDIEGVHLSPHLHALRFWAKGEVEKFLHKYTDKAISYYKDDLDLESVDVSTKTRILLSIADSKLFSRELHLAEKYLNEVFKIIKSQNVSGYLKVQLFTLLAILDAKKGDYKTALSYYRQAEQLNRDYSTSYLMDIIYNGIGTIFSLQKQYEEAEYYLMEAIRFGETRKNRDDASIARRYCNLGIVFRLNGKYNCSIEALNSAIKIINSINNKPDIFNSKVELAKTYKCMGRYLETKQLCYEVIEHCPHSETLADAWYIIAEIHKENHDLETAIIYFEKALKLLENWGEYSPFLPRMYKQLGDLYNQVGRYSEAALMYEKGLNLMKPLGL